MKYCKPTNHKFKLEWVSGKIRWVCKNCPCKRIAYGVNKRYNDFVKDFGQKCADEYYESFFLAL